MPTPKSRSHPGLCDDFLTELTDDSPTLAGVSGAGKSLLLRRLMNLQKAGRVEPNVDADVVPSVGVDICNVPLDKNKKIQLKEVGGAMLPLWPTVRPRATIFNPHPLMPPPNLGSRRAHPSSPSPRVSTSTALLRWCTSWMPHNEFQLGVSAASFHLLCTLPALRGKPVLLVWNKLDAPCPLPRVETTEAFELDRARAVLGEGV